MSATYQKTGGTGTSGDGTGQDPWLGRQWMLKRGQDHYVGRRSRWHGKTFFDQETKNE